MPNGELKSYVKDALVRGQDINQISKDLIENDWLETDILLVFYELGIIKNNTKRVRSGLLIFLSISLVFLGTTSFYLWNNSLDLTKTNSKKVQDFYAKLSGSQVAFTNAGDI